ncbi:MAG: hypothetical protein JNM00_04530 [Flavobacteriales bacterium]|nr:hypothetical protein [Flavobacteriales bacterium]
MRIFTSLLAMALCLFANAQQKERIQLFVNCQSYCYLDYLRSDITWVDYVRDIPECDVSLLITSLQTGSSGTEYQLVFTGSERFVGLNDTLTCTSSGINTDDEVRKLLSQTVKLGLMRYAVRTPSGTMIEINHPEGEGLGEGSNPEHDPFHGWVFSVGLNANADGQKIFQSSYAGLNFSASQVLESHKFGFYGNTNYNDNKFIIDGVEEIYVQRSSYFSGSYIKSITPKFSAGVFSNAGTSDYNNIDLNTNLSAAIEYNFFPYTEAQTKALAWSYLIGGTYYDFHERTIFNNTEQMVPEHRMSLALSITKPWGNVSCAIQASSFLNTIARHSYGGWANIDVRIFKGLSANAFFTYDVIHDQINLPGGGASDAEIFLQQQVLETNYSYFSYIGINYRFGSIYNNVVNPRFDLGNGSFSFSY